MKRKLWIILALAALMAALCCGAAMADGSCGENVTWSLQPRTGVLTISGTGPTYNYGLSRTNLPPFYNARSSIRSIVIQDGVTGVGEYLFVDAANVTSVTLPASVEGIGTYAFYRCTALSSVTVSNPNAVIGASAFANCSASLKLRGWDPSTAKTYAEANGIPFESLSSSGQCGDNVYYTLNSVTGELTITGTGSMWDYDIRTNRSPFTARTDISSVVFGSDIVRIGTDTFCNCSNIKSVSLPTSLYSIGTQAFLNCSGLTAVTLPEGLNTIGRYAFGRTGLTSVVIPNSVSNIEEYAFYECSSLTKAIIQRKYTSCGTQAFGNLPARFVLYVPAKSWAEDYAQDEGISYLIGGICGEDVMWVYNPDTLKLTISGTGNMRDYPNYTDQPWYPYAYDGTITSVIIADGVTSIGRAAFTNIYSLTSIDIADSVTSISDSAFMGCNALNSIIIPDSVTDIGAVAFMYDTGLTSITIPRSVVRIFAGAFDYCSNLHSVTILNPSCLLSPSHQAIFQNCASSLTLYGYSGSTTEAHAETWSIPFVPLQNPGGSCGANLTWTFNPVTGTLTINGTGKMTSAPWTDYKEYIQSVIIGDGVTEICNYAFQNCSNLTSVTLPNTLTRIGTCAFENCTSLTEMTLPDSLTSIGTGAFYNCASLSSINIPDGVTEIGNNAFERCGSLTEITIPYSVNSIGFFAFCECTSLKRVTFLGPATVIGNSSYDVFTGCTAADFTIYGYLGSSAQTYANAAGHNFVAITAAMSAPDFVIPPNTLRIEAEAFSGAKMSVVYIPDSVIFLGIRAFENCMNLKEIRIPDSITEIPFSVFTGVPKSQLIIFGKPGSAAQTFANSEGIRFIAE